MGAELRRRRHAARLTQGELGHPFTRAYVSAVEQGQILPSLAALGHMLERLDASLADFFAAIEDRVPGGPAPLDAGVSFGDGDPPAHPSPRGGRPP